MTEAIANENSPMEEEGIWKECSNCGWIGTVETNRKKCCPECNDKGTMSPTEIHVKTEGQPTTIVGTVDRVSRTKEYPSGYDRVGKYFIFVTDEEGNEHKASVDVYLSKSNFEHARIERDLVGARFEKPLSGDKISYQTWNEKKGWGSVISLDILDKSAREQSRNEWIAEQKAQEKAICQGQCGKCMSRISQAGNEYLFCKNYGEPVFKAKKYCDVFKNFATNSGKTKETPAADSTCWAVCPGDGGGPVALFKDQSQAESAIELFNNERDTYYAKKAFVVGGVTGFSAYFKYWVILNFEADYAWESNKLYISETEAEQNCNEDTSVVRRMN